MKISLILVFLLSSLPFYAQEEIQWIEELNIEEMESNVKNTYWLKMIDNGMSQPVGIPVIVLKGSGTSPVVGLTAAIHGNELNGIMILHQLIEEIDVHKLNGTIVAIPGLNGISIPLHRRRFFDDEDLNRIFPGKQKGNRSQQYVWQINNKVLSKLDYLVDMHTASFGRENTLYVRANLEDKDIKTMAFLQDADIILHNKGLPSTENAASSTRTMRAEAMLKGIPCITVEYGNPQVFQPEIILRGKKGINNILKWLKMIDGNPETVDNAVVCQKSYWIYVEEGGYLEVKVGLNQLLKKGELVALMRNPFGRIIKEYYCPEDGIVIGRSSNPINMSGGRIIHLGIIDD